MSRLWLLLVVGSVVGFVTAGAGGEPKVLAAEPLDKKVAKPDDRPPPDAELRTLEVGSKRDAAWSKVNGVSLDIDVTVNRKFAGDDIVVAWRVSYDGPRQPLIVVAPTIEKKTNGTTRVIVYAVPEGKKVAWAYDLVSPPEDRQPPNPFDPYGFTRITGLPKEFFLTVESGKQGKGEIVVPANRLRKYLADRKADKFFDPKNPPRIFVEVRHYPADRGERHNLDAWTGKLEAGPVEAPQLKNW